MRRALNSLLRLLLCFLRFCAFDGGLYRIITRLCSGFSRRLSGCSLGLSRRSFSLQALLSTPEPNDPQDAVVARQYLDSYEEFVKHAKEWTAKYASENRKDEKEEKLKAEEKSG